MSHCDRSISSASIRLSDNRVNQQKAQSSGRHRRSKSDRDIGVRRADIHRLTDGQRKLDFKINATEAMEKQLAASGVVRCGKNWVTGPAWGVAYYVLLTIVMPSLLFCVTDLSYLAVNFSYTFPVISTFLLFMTLVNFFNSACRDPGVVPRATVDEAVHNIQDILQSRGNKPYKDLRKLLRGAKQMLSINNGSFEQKFCHTCFIWRPPRSSHCSTCDNCVAKFDHHCPWLGNCVGIGNYRQYLAFLIFLFCHCLCTIVLSCVKQALYFSTENFAAHNLLNLIPSAVVIAAASGGAAFGATILKYHYAILRKGRTTREDEKFKEIFKQGENIFHHNGGLAQELTEVVLKNQLPSVLPSANAAQFDEKEITD